MERKSLAGDNWETRCEVGKKDNREPRCGVG